MHRVLPPLALLLVLVACTRGGERSAATAVPFTTRAAATAVAGDGAATELVPRQTERFVIALPAGWRELPLAVESIQQAAREAEGRNPRLTVVLRSLLEGERYKQLEYFAFDPATGDSVNVVRTSVAPGTTVVQVVNESRQALPQTVPGLAVTGVRTDLRINGVEAAALDYELRVFLPGTGMQTFQGLQVYLLTGDALHVISVNGPAGAGFTALAERIAGTYRPLP